MDTVARFWSHVEKTDTCWLYSPIYPKNRYGAFNIGKTKTKSHRFSWELEYGPIPEGMNVLHHCDTPACVRPDHLFLGTQKDNVLDMVQKNRHWMHVNPEKRLTGERHWTRINPQAIKPINQGEKSHTAKLTPQDVRMIRIRANHGEAQKEIAKDYPVNSSTISGIITRKYWKHID